MGQSAVMIQLGHEQLQLLGSGAVYWPTRAMLLVADLHLGKAATYRMLGQPVPMGTTRQTLAKLSAALQMSQAQRLVVLGDFLHGTHAHRSDSTVRAMLDWRDHHADLEIMLVRGNHDDRAGDPPAALRVQTVDEPHEIGTLTLRHNPDSAQPRECWLAGHTHPVIQVRGRAKDRVRLPCFVVTADGCILPAFGAFTGGHLHRQRSDETVVALADGCVYKLPGQRSKVCQKPPR